MEETEIPLVKTSADPRVTSRFAAFARRFSLDELPQLVHVIQGKMRLAGPRPLTSLELDEFYGDSAAEILEVLPGITGLWQVMGRNRLTYKQRLRLDRFFVRRSGLGLYLWVLLRTPASVLRGNGAC
jgi:lipopolysaccharide/colanic/teichoic acid biosynthesis glycosyltransferase